MNIEIALRELNPLDSAVMKAIGKLRVAAYSQCTSAVHPPGEVWIDEFDSASRHFGVFDGEKLISAARFSAHQSIDEAPDHWVYEGVFKTKLHAPFASLNRLVTHPNYRRLGCASLLDAVRLTNAKLMSCRCVICHACDDRHAQLEQAGFLNLGKGNDHPQNHFLYTVGSGSVFYRTLLDIPECPITSTV